MSTTGAENALPPGCPPPPAENFWIFAYGSLIWDPGFPFEEARPGLLRGWHRSFCLYSMRYRGTPDRPGLVLGLDRGGACRGIAYRVATQQGEKVMAYLWEREMPNRVYACRDVTVEIETGPITARTFVVRRDTSQYAGKLSLARTVDLICQGHGQRGPCRTYLENTVRHLDKLGIPDGRLHALLRAVENRQDELTGG